MKDTLWTKNFTIITIGTIISAIGSRAMQLVFSYIVFDETQSTFLSGTFASISLIPMLILPLIASVWLDRFERKKIVVGLDCLNGILYFLFSLYVMFLGFNFVVYLIFSLIISCTGSIYQVAYQSLYPNLIPKGFSQKGYTISGMIYPTVTVVVSPIASYVYTKVGIAPIGFFYACMLLLASFCEHFIQVKEKVEKTKVDFRRFVNDFKECFIYLKKEKGLQVIYTTMPVSQGYAEGSYMLLVPYFSNTPGLGVTLFSFFVVVEFIGRTLGGLFQYKVDIPAKYRFRLSYWIYMLYAIMDAILLWTSYPFMLLNRMICGFCGINSATLRESSVQNYIPDSMRAKLNACMNVAYILASSIFTFIFGILGEWIEIPWILTIGAIIEMSVYYFWLYRHKKVVEPVYNYEY